MQLHVRSIMSTEVTLEKVRTLLKEFRTAMMITTGPDGALHTRPMALQGDVSTFGGTLWFFAAHDSEKMSEIGRGRTARLTLQSDAASIYMYMEGDAAEVADKAKMKELYTPIIKTWFPEGLEDPNLTLIRFDAHRVTCWDSPGGMLRVLAAFAKSVATGKPGQGGEMGELTL